MKVGFYHIPKTGGTTMSEFLKNCNNIDIKEIHINKNYLSSNCYNNLNINSPIFILFRNPIEHYYSSYFFYIRYIKLLNISYDYTLKNYVNDKRTQNQQIQFLTKKKNIR